MTGKEFEGVRPDLLALQSPAGTGLGERLKKDNEQNKTPLYQLPLGGTGVQVYYGDNFKSPNHTKQE